MIRSGIYQIRNTINGKIYIGSAVKFSKRFELHRRLLRNNKHLSKYLQSAWNKYGADAFEFEILELVSDRNKLLDCEKFWLDKTQCYNREIGYNSRTIPNNNLGLKFSEETKRKMSLAHLGEPKFCNRKPELWPHELGNNCICEECKQKKRAYHRNYEKIQRDKTKILPFIMVVANV